MLYDTLLFLHILAIASWFGSAVALRILMARGERSRNAGLLQGIGAEAPFFSKMIFMPLSLIVLVTGVSMVIKGPWSFGEPFVSFGLFVIIVAVLMGPLLMAPTSSKLKAAMAEHGPTHESVVRLKGRLNAGSSVVLVLLVIATWMMVAKPGS